MNTKIKRHTKITYETTDNNIFNTKKEADDWQNVLDTLQEIPMYDKDFNPTDNISNVFYVYLKNDEQVTAFNRKSRELGYSLCDNIPEPGYYRYNNGYINVKNEIYDLQNIVDILDGKEGKDINVSTNES